MSWAEASGVLMAMPNKSHCPDTFSCIKSKTTISGRVGTSALSNFYSAIEGSRAQPAISEST